MNHRFEPGLERSGRHNPRWLTVLLTTVAVAACSRGSPLPGGSAGPGPSATQGSSATAVTPIPTLAGSVPPTTLDAWRHLDLSIVTGGPAGESVVAWTGGYLALGGYQTGQPMHGWISRDGRSWVELAPGTFGTLAEGMAAPLADGLVVLGADTNGVLIAASSTDGIAWTTSRLQPLRLGRVRALAGAAEGAVAVVEANRNALVASSDGVSWSTVTLPGAGQTDVQDVAPTPDGFIAAGSLTPSAARTGVVLAASRPVPIWPEAWSSTDGRTWQEVGVPHLLDGGFVDVEVGASGLIAGSFCCGAPGLYSRWASIAGGDWRPTLADPLGTLPEGQGGGSANGLFSGDGTRLLAYGSKVAPTIAPLELWTSLDGRSWTQLELQGDAAAALAADPAPYLLRDGILLVARSHVWFGAASP